MKFYSLSSLASFALALNTASADTFNIFLDEFDNGDVLTAPGHGGWDRISNSFPNVEENSVLTWGDTNEFGFANAEFHSKDVFAFPAGEDSYSITWDIETIEVTSPGTNNFTDLFFEFSLAALTSRKGAETVEAWPSRGGVISLQTTYKGGNRLDAEGNEVLDENDQPIPNQASLNVHLKDPALDANGTGFTVVRAPFDPTVEHQFRAELTATTLTVFIDDEEVISTDLVIPDEGVNISGEAGNGFADGFFLMMRGQGRNDGEAFMGIDRLSVNLESDTSPLAWPEGATSVAENFDGAVARNFSLSGWTQVELPTPVTEVTVNTDDENGLGSGNVIGDSNESADGGFWYDPNNDVVLDESFGLIDFNPALPAIDPPVDLNSLNEGFGNQWAQSLGSASHQGAMTIRYEQLPAHTGIDIDFLLAAFDSFDGDDRFPTEPVGEGEEEPEQGNFRILVNGEVVYNGLFGGGGILFGGPESVTTLGNNLNFSSQYREHWGPERSAENIENSSFGREPLNEDDRHTIIWARDSAYDYSGLFSEEGGTIIPHTSDTLEITIEHALDSGFNPGFTDEGFAIDSLEISLIGIGEAPATRPVLAVLSADGSSVNLSWTDPADGALYTVERSTDLSSETNWSEIATDVSTTTFEDTDLPEGTKAFYRVIRQSVTQDL